MGRCGACCKGIEKFPPGPKGAAVAGLGIMPARCGGGGWTGWRSMGWLGAGVGRSPAPGIGGWEAAMSGH